MEAWDSVSRFSINNYLLFEWPSLNSVVVMADSILAAQALSSRDSLPFLVVLFG
jgi:hypothetical protein